MIVRVFFSFSGQDYQREIELKKSETECYRVLEFLYKKLNESLINDPSFDLYFYKNPETNRYNFKEVYIEKAREANAFLFYFSPWFMINENCQREFEVFGENNIHRKVYHGIIPDQEQEKEMLRLPCFQPGHENNHTLLFDRDSKEEFMFSQALRERVLAKIRDDLTNQKNGITSNIRRQIIIGGFPRDSVTIKEGGDGYGSDDPVLNHIFQKAKGDDIYCTARICSRKPYNMDDYMVDALYLSNEVTCLSRAKKLIWFLDHPYEADRKRGLDFIFREVNEQSKVILFATDKTGLEEKLPKNWLLLEPGNKDGVLSTIEKHIING